MIVREVLTKPELVQNFDWFNDGKDTMLFLIAEVRNLKGILYNVHSESDPRFNRPQLETPHLGSCDVPQVRPRRSHDAS